MSVPLMFKTNPPVRWPRAGHAIVQSSLLCTTMPLWALNCQVHKDVPGSWDCAIAQPAPYDGPEGAEKTRDSV